MKKRDKVLVALRRVLLGDVYRRLDELERRVGSLGSEVLPGGGLRYARPLAHRVADLERSALLTQPIGSVKGPLGSDFLG